MEGIMGPGSGFRVVLDSRGGDLAKRQALHGAVVEVDMGQFGRSVFGLPTNGFIRFDGRRSVWGKDRKAVVLAGDLDCGRDQVLDWVVGAVVAERKLVGLEADGAAKELVS